MQTRFQTCARGLSILELQNLLFFITDSRYFHYATTRIIGKPEWSQEKLPTSATCFNTLYMPLYDSEALMARKISMATANCKGYGLIWFETFYHFVLCHFTCRARSLLWDMFWIHCLFSVWGQWCLYWKVVWVFFRFPPVVGWTLALAECLVSDIKCHFVRCTYQNFPNRPNCPNIVVHKVMDLT